MKHEIKNGKLSIAVNETGAELCNIKSAATGKEFMWSGDPAIWGSTSPVLFPAIGAVKNGFVKYKGSEYKIPRHGFVRNNTNVELVGQTEESLSFGLTDDEELLKIYPFPFSFQITYKLKGNKIEVSHKITNRGTDVMLFSLGAHPAFKCPINEQEDYEDYYLEFEHPETASTWLLASDGLVGTDTKQILDQTNILPLTHSLFDNDALIFKNLKSRKVALKSKNTTESVIVTYQDFNYLGIWAKPNGDFVCIEPWLGIADSANANQQLEDKEGILSLQAGGTFEASYTIEITE
ncbi:aldose 1-epimerase family protein [Dyadobacter luteus]|uniref:Aldose 1-epimerase family protein n=1 Tax=Dyadobacter luteus TaxID=2259619 RepID=A0A3D8Y9N4_9BACT|nr:aldose 1-epimerase family protein [Dyadobacter luteus]REA59719.1 aldose 1-epimerase family protein [Dyadobacter luteus]